MRCVKVYLLLAEFRLYSRNVFQVPKGPKEARVFRHERLHQIKTAIKEDKVNCFGYLMWGPIDLISATTGEMKKRYGFVYVDQDDAGNGSKRRIPKDSYYWYKQYIENWNL